MATMPSKVGASHSPRADGAARPAVAAVGVGDQPQMPQDPPQPGWVQPTGGLHQHGFGLGGDVVGQVVGALGQHPGVGSRDVPSVTAWAVAVRGPRNRARAVRTALLAAAAPRRSRPRSQAAVEPA